jgi:CheY-like chemotaxis protein/HPt (histidine-containing phosphotransfer) domain-containing protein
VTESAGNGIDGLALARSKPFAVILLDWELPGMSGLEVARALREDPQFPKETRIAGMTAYASAEDERTCLEAGMDVFLSKPISHHQLLEILEQATGRVPVLNGPGLLNEMAHGGDLREPFVRWMEYHGTYRSELEAAISAGNAPSVRKAAHRLLGHLRMLDLDRLPGITADLMTAAQADDMAGIQQEWETLLPLLDQLEQEVKERIASGN